MDIFLFVFFIHFYQKCSFLLRRSIFVCACISPLFGTKMTGQFYCSCSRIYYKATYLVHLALCGDLLSPLWWISSDVGGHFTALTAEIVLKIFSTFSTLWWANVPSVKENVWLCKGGHNPIIFVLACIRPLVGTKCPQYDGQQGDTEETLLQSYIFSIFSTLSGPKVPRMMKNMKMFDTVGTSVWIPCETKPFFNMLLFIAFRLQKLRLRLGQEPYFAAVICNIYSIYQKWYIKYVNDI